jgi:flap endonuclease-1
MGIKSFTKFLSEEAPAAIRLCTDLERYRGTTMAIDVSIYMYRFAYTVGSTPLSCTRQFLKMHRRLCAAGIRPVFVFDGRPSAQKQDVIRRRVQRRDSATAPRGRVTAEHYAAFKRELQCREIAFASAAGDAEKTCAYLSRQGLVDVVASDDFDALAYGAAIVLRNLNSSPLMEVNRAAMMEHAGFDERRFLEFCVLCGCDFTPRGFRLGMRRALEAVRGADADSLYASQIGAALGEFRNVTNPLSRSEPSSLPFVEQHFIGVVVCAMVSSVHAKKSSCMETTPQDA